MEDFMDTGKSNQLKTALETLNIHITDKQCGQLLTFYDCLVEKNKVMNLTAITEFDEVVTKHFLDSAALVKVFDLEKKEIKVLDLGTGAGFPGLPLKILFPNLKVTLMDSLNKRIVFLQEVIDTLQLTDIWAVHGRAEEYAKKEEYRENFDLCVSRAVANLSTLSEYCIPFVALGGYFIPYKSGTVEEEINSSKKAIQLFGGELEKVTKFVLPNSDIERSFVTIKKIEKTKQKYPRMGGKPAKEPIV
jgi:16S rRNA (guanine527-N7)-methyltransferase